MQYAIGIDIGATKIRGVIANSAGKILVRREILTKAKRKKAAILNDIIDNVKFLKKSAEKKNLKLAGAGIGLPGVIKKAKIIFGGGTLKQLIGVNFKNLIEKKTGLKTIAVNDSAAFAFAESCFGAGKKFNRVAGIIWGSGIGSGIIDKKKRSRASLEVGHIVVEPNIKNEPKCGCGQRGCVENLASGKNIIRRYYARGGKISAKGGSASGGKNVGVREIYFSKEKIAKEVLEDAYKYLGMGISILIKKTKPEIIVIGGGVSNLPPPAQKKLRNYVAKYLVKTSTKKFPPPPKADPPPAGKEIADQLRAEKIVKSKLGDFAGALGAATLVFDK